MFSSKVGQLPHLSKMLEQNVINLFFKALKFKTELQKQRVVLWLV